MKKINGTKEKSAHKKCELSYIFYFLVVRITWVMSKSSTTTVLTTGSRPTVLEYCNRVESVTNTCLSPPVFKFVGKKKEHFEHKKNDNVKKKKNDPVKKINTK